MPEDSCTMLSNLKKMMNVRMDYPGGALLSPKAIKPEEVERGAISKNNEIVSEQLAKPLTEFPAKPTVAKEMRLLERLHVRLEQHFSDGHGWFYTTPRGHLEIFSKITEY